MKKDLEYKLIGEKERRLRELPEFIADFIYDIENKYKLKTQIAYIKDFTVFFEYLITLPKFEGKERKDFTIDDLKNLEKRDVRDFLNYVSSYKKTFNSKNGSTVSQRFTNNQQGKARKLASLHTLFCELSKNEAYGIKDITRHIEIKVDDTRALKNSLEQKQIDRFLETIIKDKNIETDREKAFHQKAKLRDYVIALLLSYTGIRVSELVQLDLTDVNLDKSEIVVIRKGGTRDKVYLPDIVVESLGKFIKEREKIKGVNPVYKKALFLSSQRKRMTDRNVRYLIKKYNSRSRIKTNITPHTFRRSFGMKFYNSTGDMELTAEVLGHRSIETARRFYARATEDRKRKAMQGFNYEENEEKIDLNKVAQATGLSVEELRKML